MITDRLLLAVLLAVGLTACEPPVELLAPGAEKVRGEEAGIAGRMVDAIREISLQRHPEGKVLRFNQSKSLGCVRGRFTVLADIPGKFAHGVFARPAEYPALLRYANATQFDDTEKDFRGLSIKLSGVTGGSLWGEQGTQDFVLNSYPALFAADAEDFLSFIEATRDDQRWRYFINPAHLYSLRIIFKGRERIDDPFATRFWSTTAYQLGDDSRAVKYSVRQCPGTAAPQEVEQHRDFLSAVMSQRLASAEVCLEFMVQAQTDPAHMPVENAAVIWDEQQSPFVPVATITLPLQSLEAESSTCEALSFNPWQSLPEHRPLGGINRVRKAVYAEIAEFRSRENKNREAL